MTSPAFKPVLIGAGLLFAVCVGLGLHGFSLPYWHELVLDAAPTEVVAGAARRIRWDDYTLQLPAALAQITHDPPFPVVNENIGSGQNMLVPLSLPVAHPVTLFRPGVWGFFLGPDAGLAWMWWSQIAGLFAVWLAVFHRLLRAPLGVACAGCGLLLAAPVFEFFSFNMAVAVAGMGLSLLALMGVLGARSARGILASGLTLGWAGGSFLLTLYPAYLVSLGALFLVLTAALCVERRDQLRALERKGLRAIGLVLALTVAACAVCALRSGAGEAIEALRSTEYPGARISTGGERPLWWFMTANLGAPLQLGPDSGDWGDLRSICASASFWLVSPVLLAACLWRWLRAGSRPDALLLGLFLFSSAGLAYCHFGFPEWLARATLLSEVPAKRMQVALAVAEVLLVVRYLSLRPVEQPERGAHALISVTWAGALFLGATHLVEANENLSLTWMGALAALNGVAVFGLLRGRWRVHVLVAVVGLLGVSTLWFNPLVRGGSAVLYDNPVARGVAAVDRAAEGETLWAVYGDAQLGSMLVANNVRVLNGVQTIPQLDLWGALGVSEGSSAILNRFASIKLRWPSPPNLKSWFKLEREGSYFVYLDPGGDGLQELGVTHVLAPTTGRHSRAFRHFEPSITLGDQAIFTVPLAKKSAAR